MMDWKKKIWVNRLNLGNSGCWCDHLSLRSERNIAVAVVHTPYRLSMMFASDSERSSFYVRFEL